MTTIIQIAFEESSEAVARVQRLLDETALHNPNWNGAEFTIERDDFTCIPDREDADAVSLFYDIQRALRNEI